jgi:hypothetical protein
MSDEFTFTGAYDTRGETVPSLGETKLLGEAVADAFKKSRNALDPESENKFVSYGENALFAEIKKLGLDAATIAEAWDCDETVLRGFIENGFPERAYEVDVFGRRYGIPLNRLGIDIVREACMPLSTARELIFSLAGGAQSGTPEQLSVETIARYSGLSPEELIAFRDGNDSIPEAKLTRLCVALLLVDRELNFKRRKYYVFHGDKMCVVRD